MQLKRECVNIFINQKTIKHEKRETVFSRSST